MNKIGLFYSFNSNKTAKIAEKIRFALSDVEVQDVNVEAADENSIDQFDILIFGVPRQDQFLHLSWD